MASFSDRISAVLHARAPQSAEAHSVQVFDFALSVMYSRLSPPDNSLERNPAFSRLVYGLLRALISPLLYSPFSGEE
jgi:hypothetical protein